MSSHGDQLVEERLNNFLVSKFKSERPDVLNLLKFVSHLSEHREFKVLINFLGEQRLEVPQLSLLSNYILERGKHTFLEADASCLLQDTRVAGYNSILA